MALPRVAVIIPTLQEARTISGCLERLRAQGADRVVVVDADSPDGTANLARASGLCEVLNGPRNRGLQQNLGAAACPECDIVLFLHADTWLAPGSLDLLRRFVVSHPGVPGGCFRMRVDTLDPRVRLIDAFAHLRAGLFHVPYGDQAVFATRPAFDTVGGFPAVPFMDDVGLALRLGPLGRLALLPVPAVVHVSDRRWRSVGLLRQTLKNWTLTALYALGVPPETLKKAYPAVR